MLFSLFIAHFDYIAEIYFDGFEQNLGEREFGYALSFDHDDRNVFATSIGLTKTGGQKGKFQAFLIPLTFNWIKALLGKTSRKFKDYHPFQSLSATYTHIHQTRQVNPTRAKTKVRDRDVIKFSSSPRVVDLSALNAKRAEGISKGGKKWMPRKDTPPQHILERKMEAGEHCAGARVKGLLDCVSAM
ncbi:hypothetical protein AZE42_09951 [Rhizopogon vesiculosus]|uniref:Uncharacterized protein n=1 Tax=Rhizopogon vesiculosus TaxID=180088 RepID=A0A1J8PTS8_9AGAM|nr:hypothetical protein AZE42_09951 [Rhizopogon vesiculosus]